jgi:hypothetical protein
VLVVVFVLCGAALWWSPRRAVWFGLLVGVIPLLLLAVVSARLNVFTPRYVLGAAPAYVLVVAGVVGRVRRGKAVQWGQALLAVGWFGVLLYSLNNYFGVPDYAKSPDWPSLVAYLEREAAPDDIIVQAAADEALNFYYEEYGLNIDRKQLPANPQQSATEITFLLTQDMETHRSIWRVGQTFPDWPSADIVESWLGENMQQVRSTAVSGIRTEQYMPWEVSESEVAGSQAITYDNAAELSTWHIIDAQNRADHITVWLYWRALVQTETPLKVFVQLVREDSFSVVSQNDHFPQEGRISTSTWMPNTLYRDVYTLALDDVPAGNYTLITGLYNPETGERMRVGSEDYVALKSVRVS